MLLTVQIDPDLEVLLEKEARRLGMSKSELVIDVLERTLRMTNPADILRQARSGMANNDPNLSASVSKRMKSQLLAKHRD